MRVPTWGSLRWLPIALGLIQSPVSASLSRAHEKTSAVNLEDENVLGAQASVGAVARISVARVAVEYNVARVHSLSIKVGVGRGGRGST